MRLSVVMCAYALIVIVHTAINLKLHDVTKRVGDIYSFVTDVAKRSSIKINCVKELQHTVASAL